MADTPDMAPNRPAARAASRSRKARPARSSDSLERQVSRLQDDLKAIAGSVTSLAEDKVSEARRGAKKEVKNLVRSGQHVLDDVQDEFGQIEKQIKDTIREKPLTAVAGALALGFLLAVITR